MKPVQHSPIVEQLPGLLRYARSLTRDRGAAEDLVHDALVAALTPGSGYDAERALRPWLFALIHNRFVSDRRRESTREQHRTTTAPDQAAMLPPQEEALSLRQIGEALAKMPTDQREALHLVSVEGLSYKEAAEATDVPIGTVMSRIARARGRNCEPSSRLRLRPHSISSRQGRRSHDPG